MISKVLYPIRGRVIARLPDVIRFATAGTGEGHFEEEEMGMTTTRQPGPTTHRVDTRLDLPVEDRETSFAAWSNTTMLDEDTVDGVADPAVLRGID